MHDGRDILNEMTCTVWQRLDLFTELKILYDQFLLSELA